MQPQLHLLEKEMRGAAMVSSRSFWRDSKWHFDIKKIGHCESAGTLNWAIDMGDGSNLLGPQWENLLEDCRTLAYSLLHDRRLGRPLDPFSVATVFKTKLSKLLAWMVEFGYDNFSQLNSEASWEYFEHVLAAHRKAKDNSVTPLSLQNDLQILHTIHRQGIALADAGVSAMPEAPYDGESAGRVAERAATAADGWIPPLPDEVALAMLDACFYWIGPPMDDVLALVAIHQSTKASTGTKALGRPLETALESFTFSVLPGDSKPWHVSLGQKPQATLKRSPHSPRELRTLVMHSGAACAMLIQGVTGMRISEIAALIAGSDPATKLPNCVKIRLSKTGLNELFIVESQVTKIHDGTMMEWVVGMRPTGSTYLPPAVVAIQRLDELFRPWRAQGAARRLFINPSGRPALGRAGTAGNEATLGQIRGYMKSFVATYGKLQSLPDSQQTPSGTIDLRPYKAGNFRTHQWRKTFALYVLRTDSRMLPAISQHFKHMSIAMTEQGYVGNDIELLDGIDSVRRQRTVLFLLQQASGSTVIAGGMADLVREHREKLKSVVADAEGDEAYLRMEEWVVQGDLRIWFAEHGKCFMSLAPGSARCHSIAKTDPWLNRQPNLAQRNASVCGGCKCFAVDGEHIEFWKERYRKNTLVLAATGAGSNVWYKVAQERVRQSESILRTLGVRPTEPGVEER